MSTEPKSPGMRALEALRKAGYCVQLAHYECLGPLPDPEEIIERETGVNELIMERDALRAEMATFDTIQTELEEENKRLREQNEQLANALENLLEYTVFIREQTNEHPHVTQARAALKAYKEKR